MAATPTVLITGGSSGIGLELAKLFARDNYRLVLVSKPATELQEAQKTLSQAFPDTDIICLQKDLSVEGAAAEVYAFTQEKQWPIDVLVNNAGFGTFGPIIQTDMQHESAMIRLNILCVYQLTRLFLDDMIKRRQGKIMNVASVAAFQPNPHMATYGATKAFVFNFTMALRYELKEKGLPIDVLALCPPQTHSGFQKAAQMEKANTFDSIFTLQSDEVARNGYRALMQGKARNIPKPWIAFLHKFVRRLPMAWLMYFARDSLREKS
ncbi:MAG: SDR family oxidoreductase [Bacteroidota bacterium]